MTNPSRKQTDLSCWTRFSDILAAGSRHTRLDSLASSVDRALKALCAHGELKSRLLAEGEPPGARSAPVSMMAGEEGELRAWVGWTGPDNKRDATQEVLADACDRLRPLLAAWTTLRRLSGTDPLTGAGNRRSLQEDLQALLSLSGRHGVPLSVIMLDIDAFKAVNDAHGHPAGDRALVSLTRWLAGAVRAEDRLYRYGGDEFVLLLPHTTREGADRLAGRIRDEAPQSLSLGVATAAPDESGEPLLERADQALRASKAAIAPPSGTSPRM